MNWFITFILPLIYAALFTWCIGRSIFLRRAGFPVWFTVGFLWAKMLCGMAYTWVQIRYIPAAMVDIETFFGGGVEMYQTFWKDPAAFPAYLAQVFHITDVDIARTDSDFIRTVFDGIKFLHFLLNFLSGGHLYTNLVLFNGLAAWLFLRCWAYLQAYFGQPWLGAWLFLFPSAFFFTSVLLKEGIELCLAAAVLPMLLPAHTRVSPLRLPGILLLLGLMFFFKYLIAATFAGMLLLFLLFSRWPGRALLASGLVVLVFLVVFFQAKQIHPALDLPQYLVNRRMEFLALDANSELQMRPLAPTAASFAAALPEALVHVALRPLPGEKVKAAYWLFRVEIYGFWLFILLLAGYGFKKGFQHPGPEAWAWLLFALINLLVIGYTITNTGSIIRYRSIFLPAIGYFFWMLCHGPAQVQRFFSVPAKVSR